MIWAVSKNLNILETYGSFDLGQLVPTQNTLATTWRSSVERGNMVHSLEKDRQRVISIFLFISLYLGWAALKLIMHDNHSHWCLATGASFVLLNHKPMTVFWCDYSVNVTDPDRSTKANARTSFQSSSARSSFAMSFYIFHAIHGYLLDWAIFYHHLN